ncbi:protein STICHEL-like 3 [Gossypium australe]|uniref:Protein STICHEL-like 3 n=1 Tax=Gossypium australe TaxID=47621 RepID=A0A5B6WCX7_9ROSI|nr:protein STICHEL-like 3 [Gossypium australe]
MATFVFVPLISCVEVENFWSKELFLLLMELSLLGFFKVYDFEYMMTASLKGLLWLTGKFQVMGLWSLKMNALFLRK